MEIAAESVRRVQAAAPPLCRGAGLIAAGERLEHFVDCLDVAKLAVKRR
jgi:hypothetical protein